MKKREKQTFSVHGIGENSLIATGNLWKKLQKTRFSE